MQRAFTEVALMEDPGEEFLTMRARRRRVEGEESQFVSRALGRLRFHVITAIG